VSVCFALLSRLGYNTGDVPKDVMSDCGLSDNRCGEKHYIHIKVFIYHLMHKRIALKNILKFTLKQLLHVSVQSPSSGSALFELAKAITLAGSNNALPDDGYYTEICRNCFNKNFITIFKAILLCISW